jgi:hypothetical protein
VKDAAPVVFAPLLAYRPSRGADVIAVTASSAGAVAFEFVAPYRQVRTHRRQRNYCGDWWLATTRRHVTFESWCERDYLIALDFDPGVVAVAAQPFGLQFGAADGSVRSHTPDFFVRTADGGAVVVDVRPDRLIDSDDQEKFDATAELCQMNGWKYRRVGERADPWMTNVRWLAGYRHERAFNRTIAADVCVAATGAQRISLGALASQAGDPIAVLPTIFHMLWSHQLDADLATTKLTFGTLVTLPGGTE